MKYKEDYERSRGKLIGAKDAQGDSQMSHSLQMSKLQSDLEYKKGFEDTRAQCHVSLDMVHLVHARKAQHLATDIGYKTASHHFTALPTDMRVEWAKKAYGLQSDVSSVCTRACASVAAMVFPSTPPPTAPEMVVYPLTYLLLDPRADTAQLS